MGEEFAKNYLLLPAPTALAVSTVSGTQIEAADSVILQLGFLDKNEQIEPSDEYTQAHRPTQVSA